MKHLNWCTHVQFAEDRDILTRANFDVNIRLLQCNSRYKGVISKCVTHIIICATTPKDGYKTPHGWSGANAGIPFNIIALKDGSYYINPVITGMKEADEVTTNCGSLTLAKTVKVWRWRKIDLQWYDLNGVQHKKFNIPPNPGYTIQHEIEHTQGVLITPQP